MDDKPWREWPEYVGVYAAVRATTLGSAAEEAVDALCARVWREAQAATDAAAEQHWERYRAGFVEAERARADRLAAALRRAQHSMHYTATKGHRGVAEVCEEAGCAQARAALADSPKEEAEA